jgi:hypothetical protein
MIPNYIIISIPIYVTDADNSPRGWNKNVVSVLIYYGRTPINLFGSFVNGSVGFHKPNLRFVACIDLIQF